MSLRSTVTFSAYGAYPEELVTRLMSDGIFLKNVSVRDGILYAQAERRSYLRIARTAARFGVRTRVTERRGLYFRLYRYRKRAGLVSGLAVSVLLLLILQRFVWKIEVHGSDAVSAKQVLEVLADSGVRPGAALTSFDVNSVEVELKRRIPGISWISVDVSGSAVDVYLSEAQELPKSGISLRTPCNVIAGKTGTILETQVYSGTLLYPVGSGVGEGNVVVSGIVDDGAGHLLLSHAGAKIIAEYTENVSLSMPFTTTEKQPSGKAVTEKELMLFGFVFPITPKISSAENMICDEYTSVYDLFGIKLPWKIKTFTYTEYENISVTRRTEDILMILDRRLDEYCENFFSGLEILDIEREAVQTETGITLNAKVRLKGDIAVQREIWQKR